MGRHDLPTVVKYKYMGIDFACNGAWDGHIKVLDSGRKKVNQLHSVISNRDECNFLLTSFQMFL